MSSHHLIEASSQTAGIPITLLGALGEKKKKKRVRAQEFPLWHNGIDSVLGALGSSPGLAEWVKDLVLQHLCLGSLTEAWI